METVKFDGLEICSGCNKSVGIWQEESNGVRHFIEHFVNYPEHCGGLPTQKEGGN